jgi:uncharacterized Zn-binding protein involved in type VI secretion
MKIIGFIVLGDRTSHGGKVMECSSFRFIDDVPVARVGDLVWCPRCNRATRIVTSRFPQIIEDGIANAFDMDMTDCGAFLYSRHNDHAGFAVDDDDSAAVAKARAKATANDSDKTASVQEHFVLCDEDSKSFVGLEYTLNVGDGRAVGGATDEQGRTNIVWTGTPDDTNILLHPQSTKSNDPYHFPEKSSEDN